MERSIVTLTDDLDENQYVLNIINNSESYSPITMNILFKYNTALINYGQKFNKTKVLENARAYKRGIGQKLNALIEERL